MSGESRVWIQPGLTNMLAGAWNTGLLTILWPTSYSRVADPDPVRYGGLVELRIRIRPAMAFGTVADPVSYEGRQSYTSASDQLLPVGRVTDPDPASDSV